ncbi:hypothetical protein GGF46_005030 [Coemansia sp. RSA 552]|nr:hypothetical protein GGF46_005030 [Coemansia sp. RSA 552]
MGFVFEQFIDAASIYACQGCRAHIAHQDAVISRTFQGRLGRAYLTESVVNEELGQQEDRLLMTGLHTVCNLHCRGCDTVIGWKYMRAFDKSQQYKEGRYVIEKLRIMPLEQKEFCQVPEKRGKSAGLHQSASPLVTSDPRLAIASSPSIDSALSRFMSDIGIQAGESAITR